MPVNVYVRKQSLLLVLNITKSTFKENKEIKVKKNLSLLSSIMFRKLGLTQKNDFLIKKPVVAVGLSLVAVTSSTNV